MEVILKKIKNNLEKLSSCPVCKQKKQQKIKYRDMDVTIKNIHLYECQNCKTIYTSPRTKKNKLQYLYSDEVTNFYEKEKSLISGVPSVKKNLINFRLIRLNKLVKRWVNAGFIKKQNKVLDYGCGDGLLIEALKRFNIKAEGADFSKNIDKGIMSYSDLKRDGNKYDVIILRHVLEHAHSPNELI